MSFRDAMKAITPPFLDGYWGERLRHVFALPIDAFDQVLRQAVKARMPGVGTPQALGLIGADRQIERGRGESDASYAERLSGAFDAWRTAGSARSILGQLRSWVAPASAPIAGFKLRTVNNRAAWDTIDADGVYAHRLASPANWNWDGDAGSWWRAWLILFSDGGPWSPEGTWGDMSDWGEDGALGTDATLDEIDTLRRITNKWRARHVDLPWLIVSFDGAMFDPSAAAGAPMPDGTWGPWSVDDAGNRVASRFADAIYIDGPKY